MGKKPRSVIRMADDKKPKSKIGILKYIAKGGAKGVKFEDQPETWYNPTTDECKEQVKDDYKGKQVEIILAEGKKTNFISMVLLEPKQEQLEIQEETVEEEKVEDKAQPDQVGETASNVPKKEDKKYEQPNNPRVDEMIYSKSPLQHLITSLADTQVSNLYTQKVYSDMEKTKLETATKGPMKLTYASWAEAWGALKRQHPTAQFIVHENKNGLPYFMGEESKMGAFVKVSVTVLGVTHTVHLPVMNHMNKSIMKEEMTTFDVNKNIQRALAKSIALHGMGLYVFRGEDLPDDTTK